MQKRSFLLFTPALILGLACPAVSVVPTVLDIQNFDRNPDQQEANNTPIVAQARQTQRFTGELSSNDQPVEGRYLDVITFEGEAGETLQIDLTSNNFNAFLLLLGPDQQDLGFDDDSGGGNNAQLIVELPQSGTYIVGISSFGAGETGSYEVVIQPGDPRAVSATPAPSQTTSDPRLQEADRLQQQVIQLYQQGKYVEASRIAEQVLAIREAILGDHPGTATALNDLALLYESQGRYSEAELLYQRSLSIYETQLGADHPDTATSLNNLAALYRLQGRYGEAEPLYQRSLSIIETQLGADHPDTASSLNNLAELYQTMGRYSEAEPLYQRSLSIREQQLGADHPATAQSLNNLAALYRLQGRYGEAEPLYQRSLSIRETQLGADHPLTANSLNNLAALYRAMGSYREAEPFYQRSLSIYEQQLGADHPLTATSLSNLALLYENMGRYSEAEPFYQRSLSIRETQLGADHPDTAISLNNLATLYWEQDRFDESLSFLARGLEVEEKNILANIATLTESQQRDYLNTVSASEDAIVSLHLQHLPSNPQASATALTTILRRKGRILDTLSNSLQRLRANAKPEDLARLNELSQLHTQLTKLYNQGGDRAKIQGLQAQIEQLQAKLAQNNPEFNPEPVTLDAIRNLLPTDAALIEFFQYQPYNPTAERGEKYGEPRYAAYILTPQGNPIGIDLGEAQSIDDRVARFRQELLNPGSIGLEQVAKPLYEVLFQPLEPYLGEAQHLLISPDAQLNLIPMAALMDGNGDYLLKTHQITYLSSGRDLVRMELENPSRQPPLIFGNPSYGDQPQIATLPQPEAIALRGSNERSGSYDLFDWKLLDATEPEAIAIAESLPGAKLYTQAEATETLVKQAQGPQVLHMATHGFFEADLQEAELRENPLLRSGLVFAGVNQKLTEGDDGILTALEVSGLDLRGTRLVVMSACETGLGNVQNGEGVYGLRRAFTLANAESQVMTLWKVADEATKNLMIRYYNYLNQGQGRSAALRQAQIDMLDGSLEIAIDALRANNVTVEIVDATTGKPLAADTSHPYYWAAFIPAGDWTPLN